MIILTGLHLYHRFSSSDDGKIIIPGAVSFRKEGRYMKKFTGFLLSLVLLLALAGCGTSNASPAEHIYSFSGESDVLRVTNGVAIAGGENETFYGGNLEMKNGDFLNAVDYTTEFYVPDEMSTHTFLSIDTVDKTGKTLAVQNQDRGQISGPVFNKNMELSAFETNLNFKLEITYQNGETETYTVPMQVKEITPAG